MVQLREFVKPLVRIRKTQLYDHLPMKFEFFPNSQELRVLLLQGIHVCFQELNLWLLSLPAHELPAPGYLKSCSGL